MNLFRRIDISTKWMWDHRGEVLCWIRDRTNELGRVLDNTRASVVIVAAGAFVFFFTGQGRDITAGIEDLDTLKNIPFILAIGLWAFAGWYWARLILDVRNVREEKKPFLTWLANHIPRILGVSAFLFAAVALFRSTDWSWQFFLTVALGVVFYLFVLFRTKMKFMGQMSASPFKKVNRWWLGLGFAANGALLIWAIFSPGGLGNFLGAGTLIFIMFFSWLHLAGYAVYLTATKGFPIMKLALVMAVVFSLMNDNHDIRHISGDKLAESDRTSVAKAYDSWSGDNNEKEKKPPAKPGRPLIVVATAGGGLRAAYWTATVLGAAADQAPKKFTGNLFAISGVSGGSLGATVFNTVLLRYRLQKCLKGRGRDPKCEPGIAGLGQKALNQDFLAPSLASLGYPDLLQRFIPFEFFTDRAAALEDAWAHAWGKVLPQRPNLMEASFLSLWEPTSQDAEWLPALLLNGTHQQSGKRMITSNLDILDRDANGAIFPDALDFFAEFGCHIRVNTAALNSARFTFVSPAGTIRCRGESRGNLLDGGYFENFGAITARELLQALSTLPGFRKNSIRPIVIQISSDPELPPKFLTKPLKLEKAGTPIANETLAPLRTMISTREGRGSLAAKHLRQWVTTFNKGKKDGPAKFFHFRLAKGGAVNPPLGWVLSKAARKEIRDQLTREVNACPFGRLMTALGATPPEFATGQEWSGCCECSK